MKCKYLGGAGVLQVPADMTQKLQAGVTYNVDISKQRSSKEHNMLFRAIGVALMNWPEEHPFQPNTAEHLRYWLEVKAGYGNTVIYEDPIQALRALQSSFVDKAFAEVSGDRVYVHIPRSIAYGKMGKTNFHDLVEAIDSVLQQEAGFSLADCALSATEDVGYGQ